MNFFPALIDTTCVAWPPELASLMGRLARNPHEIGDRQRLMDGRVMKPQHDNATETHPWPTLRDHMRAWEDCLRVNSDGVLRAVLTPGCHNTN